MKKYEITDIVHPDNPNLHRIRAVTDLTEDVLAGMLGGYVESCDKESRRQELNQQVQLLAKKLHNLSRLCEKNCITAAQYWERRNPLERELTDVKAAISKAATNHPLLRTLAQTKQLAGHYTYLKPLADFDEHEFKFAVTRVLVDSESCTFELKNGMKFKEIF